MVTAARDDERRLDGCELDFDDPATNTDDEAVAALVLFADIDTGEVTRTRAAAAS